MKDKDNPALRSLSSPIPAIEPERLDRVDIRDRPKQRETVFLPAIDISLVTYNSQKWFPAFFASLAKQSFPLSKIHLYVIDHSPNDECIVSLNETLSTTLSRYGSVHIERRENRGFGAGHNRTLALGQSEFVLVSNVDLTFELDSLANLVAEAVAAEKNFASWECRQKPYEHPKIYNIVTHETPWSSSACVLLRRQAWQEIAGYDDRFFMYGEDVDLSYRMRDSGWKLAYCPNAVVWHHTYDSANAVKETQYFGSTLANMLIRLRFGKPVAILDGLLLQLSLLFHMQPFPNRLGKLWRNYLKLFHDAPYFLMSRRKSREIFPLQDWDYAMRRDGAFYEHRSQERDLPLVSIIVRTYPGRLPLLREALQSLTGQTYHRVEVIVVEDGGNSSAEYVQSLRQNSHLNLVYYSAPKRGRSHTGNIGLELSRGELVGFLDDDDLLFADHIEVMVESMLDHPASKAAYSYAWEIETSHAETWLPYEENVPKRKLVQGFDRAMLWFQNYIPIQSIMFRRELYETYGGFFEELDYLEDWDLWQRYALSGDFLCVEKTTSIYRTPADPDVRTRRMTALTEYYDKAVARQFAMRREYSVGEMREFMKNGNGGFKSRLTRLFSEHPRLYRQLRYVVHNAGPFKTGIFRLAALIESHPILLILVALVVGIVLGGILI